MEANKNCQEDRIVLRKSAYMTFRTLGEVCIDMIAPSIEATGRAVASGAISPDKAPKFLEDLTYKAWNLVKEIRRDE